MGKLSSATSISSYAEEFSTFSTRATSRLLTSSTQFPYFPSAAQRVKDIPAGAIPYIALEDLILFKIYSCHRRGQCKALADARDAFSLLGIARQPLVLTEEQRVSIAAGASHALELIPEFQRALFRRRLGLDTTNIENGQDGSGDVGEANREDDVERADGGKAKNNLLYSSSFLYLGLLLLGYVLLFVAIGWVWITGTGR